jgi:hypothetical protein
VQEATPECLMHAEQKAKKNSIPQIDERFAWVVSQSDEFENKLQNHKANGY